MCGQWKEFLEQKATYLIASNSGLQPSAAMASNLMATTNCEALTVLAPPDEREPDPTDPTGDGAHEPLRSRIRGRGPDCQGMSKLHLLRKRLEDTMRKAEEGRFGLSMEQGPQRWIWLVEGSRIRRYSH